MAPPTTRAQDTGDVAPAVAGAVQLAAGGRRMALAQALTQGCRLGTSLLLARLLAPQEFGLVAVALVVCLFLDQLRDLGTGTAVIQRPQVDPRFLNGVFLLNLGTGIVLAGTLAATAAPLAAAMGAPDASGLLGLCSVVVLLGALGQVHHALLRRHMDFHAVALVTAWGALVAALVSVLLAVRGHGAWAVVWGNLVGAAVGTGLSWKRSGFRPGLETDWGQVRGISAFSLHLCLVNLVYFFFVQADKVLVGRWLGPAALGIYAFAQRVLMYPVMSVAEVLQEVLFPALAQRQEDDAALRRAYLRSVEVVALVTFPLMAGTAVVAQPLVGLALGPAWAGLVPLVWVLAPVGALQSVSSTSGSLLVAKGRSDLLLRWTLVSSAAVVGAYLVGLHHGLVGVAVAYAVAIVVLTPFGCHLAFRLVGLSLARYAALLLPHLGRTLALAGAGLAAQAVARGAGPAVSLAATVAAGAFVYVGLLVVQRPAAARDAWLAVRGQR